MPPHGRTAGVQDKGDGMTLRGIALGTTAWLALAGLPTHAVMLGGTNVAKDKFVVYLLLGHSNMAGEDMSHSDGVTDPHAWHWPIATKQWVLAKETPSAGRAAGLSGHGEGGPGMPFVKGMAAAFPGYYFGVINNASLSSTCKGENTGSNSSGLDPSDNRYFKGTYLYHELLTAAQAVQPEATLGGILCMLGTVEATRTSQEVCQAFSDDLAQLAKDLRADLGEPNLPFIMGGYEAGASGSFALTKPLPAIIDAQIKLLPSKLPLSGVVDSKGITMLDDHHYVANGNGQPIWAQRAVALIQTNKWFPPGATALRATLAPAGRAPAASGLVDGTVWLISGDGAWSVDGKAPARGAARIGDRASWAPLNAR
jgi:hypothetical protein